MAFGIVSIDSVSIGNSGNAADSSTGHGAVSHAYKIEKYEVTNAQYGEFLNAKGGSNSYGIYNANMAGFGITQSGSSGSFTYHVTESLANNPVVYVSWYDAARFANWLSNGQGSGNMEDGAYTLNGNTGLPSANPDAQIYLPSEDEWYKAAYYNAATASYSLCPNGKNTITTADANYSSSGASIDVGTYVNAPSFYGTYDQAGNVWEWYDADIDSSCGVRGGSWDDGVHTLGSPNFVGLNPDYELAAPCSPAGDVRSSLRMSPFGQKGERQELVRYRGHWRWSRTVRQSSESLMEYGGGGGNRTRE